MRAVLTVTGKDKAGIIACVGGFLAEKNVSVLDISQTIMSDYFAMIMLVDISNCTVELAQLSKEFTQLGQTIGMAIHLQHEDIFNVMHNI